MNLLVAAVVGWGIIAQVGQMLYELAVAIEGSNMTTVALFAVFLMSCYLFYMAWWRSDALIEQMLAVYKDPGDLNRWLVKIGVFKWFYRFIATALFLAMLYASFMYIVTLTE